MVTAIPVRLEIPATLKHVNVAGAVVRALLKEAGELSETPELHYNLQLAVHELCVNLVRHAYGVEGIGTIQIVLLLTYSHFVVETWDGGPHIFDLQGRPTFDAADLPEHGIGLYLIYEVMDEVMYQPTPGNNHWRLIKNLLKG
jgi:serine/threonine-protein kinase RsbW